MKYKIAQAWLVIASLGLFLGFCCLIYNLGKTGIVLACALGLIVMTGWSIRTIDDHNNK